MQQLGQRSCKCLSEYRQCAEAVNITSVMEKEMLSRVYGQQLEMFLLKRILYSAILIHNNMYKHIITMLSLSNRGHW